ncbi:copper amine oxidase [Melanogaster broomeanus]|nr:copper amine oxidase [Melanogaster broomeanus]
MAPTALPHTPAPALHRAVVTKPSKFNHPLDPLTPNEISAVTLAIRHFTAANTPIKALRFITCTLLPPPKKVVLAALGIPLTPGAQPEAPVDIIRKAESDFLDVINGGCYNAVLALTNGVWEVETLELVPDGSEPQITVEELTMCEEIVRRDPKVQALAKQVGVEPHQICADGWAIGYDDRFPKDQRLQQALMFARFSEHDNLYAHPLDFIVVVDSVAEKVVQIDFPPTYRKDADGSIKLSVDTTEAQALSDDSLAGSNRERIPPPRTAFDFLPDLMEKTDPTYKPRDDVKPLHVVQPEGVSFKIDGHTLEWQKWKMHIAFTHREGIALSTVTYNDDGEIRPILYRLSLAEMVVPYGAPEFPHPRKFAFDSGEYGMGTMANELSLGCDCLRTDSLYGILSHTSGAYVTHAGTPFVIKNAICIHEEDAGVLWKHTDYRPGGRSQTVRSRRLVVSMVCTLANYEYVWNYYFYQDGQHRARRSALLASYKSMSVALMNQILMEPPWHPVSALISTNIFSPSALTPCLTGINNSVIESDIVSLDAPAGSKENFAGNAFVVKDRVLKDQAKDGARDFDWACRAPVEESRIWARTHYSSGKPASYQIMMKGGLLPLMAKPDSWVARRASFAHKALWVVKDVEGPKGGRMWPSGKYVPQTREEPEDSVGRWVKEGQGKIDNEDIVLYLTVGTTHVPRPEDWPVMPVEHLNIVFKPFNFFTKNPSMDVPGTKDAHSKPAFSNGHSANDTHTNGSNGTTACCGN